MEIVVGPVLKSSKICLHLRLSSEVVGKSLEVVGNLRRSSEVFQNLRQSLEAVGKIIFGNSDSVATKNLAHFTENKLAGSE